MVGDAIVNSSRHAPGGEAIAFSEAAVVDINKIPPTIGPHSPAWSRLIGRRRRRFSHRFFSRCVLKMNNVWQLKKSQAARRRRWRRRWNHAPLNLGHPVIEI